MSIENLKVGMRVRAGDGRYSGTVARVAENGLTATIRRDDGVNGVGERIEGYGTGWKVRRRLDGTFGDNGGDGFLDMEAVPTAEKPMVKIAAKRVRTFTKAGKLVLKRGARVIGTYGTYIGNVTYRGVVHSVSKNGNEATIRRADGQAGSGNRIKERPYFGRRGWRVSRLSDAAFGGAGDGGSLKVFRHHHKLPALAGR